jgi:hypothetical protein
MADASNDGYDQAAERICRERFKIAPGVRDITDLPTEELTNLARTLKNRLTGINRSRRLVAFLAFAGFMQSRQKGFQKPIFDRLKAAFSSHNSPSEPFFLAT